MVGPFISHLFRYRWPHCHFWWFLWWFLSIFDVNECIGCHFLVKSLYLTSIDVNFSVKWSKKCHFLNFWDMDGHNTSFWWFLWCFLSIFDVSECIGFQFLVKSLYLTSIDVNFAVKWSKKCHFINFWDIDGQSTTCWWFLWWFLSIFDVSECIGCQFLVKSLYLTSIDVNFAVKWSKKCHFVIFLGIDGPNTTFWCELTLDPTFWCPLFYKIFAWKFIERWKVSYTYLDLFLLKKYDFSHFSLNFQWVKLKSKFPLFYKIFAWDLLNDGRYHSHIWTYFY